PPALQGERIEKETAALGVELEFKPVYSPRAGGGPDLSSPKFKYLFEDVLRFAEAYGLRLDPGPFADSRKACLGFFFAREKGRQKPYHDGVYGAVAREEGHRSGGDAGRDSGASRARSSGAPRCAASFRSRRRDRSAAGAAERRSGFSPQTFVAG
ncbi:MAG: hypothetical protein ACREQ9_06380, partial [Candidatus Binatia bacterium]